MMTMIVGFKENEEIVKNTDRCAAQYGYKLSDNVYAFTLAKRKKKTKHFMTLVMFCPHAESMFNRVRDNSFTYKRLKTAVD